ncbi:SSI family serine proteinase inhibitor [Streptomyces sp. NPDC050538]|uniref:SSI family serine proteinase inhibitor n=1 Tax=Streptomyces sp. NPDC050538 TaxID=3365627 RepID=UPI0037AF7FC5
MLQVNRFLVIVAASVATVGSLAAAPATASPGTLRPLAPPPVRDEDRSGGDHLTVTVRHAGGAADGTHELYCHPGGGTHPDVTGACAAVGRNSQWGKDPFAPVPPDSMCTMIYGGPATAHVTGTWAGRPVDATYDRGNGCEISRWNAMVPLLPDLGGGHQEHRGTVAG